MRYKLHPAAGEIILALTPVYYELLLHIWIDSAHTILNGAAMLLFALGLGCLLAAVARVLPRGGKWFAAGMTLVLTVIFMAEFFLNDAFGNFMVPSLMLSGAGGIANGFLDVTLTAIVRNWWRILLALLPGIGIAVFVPARKGSPKAAGMLCGVCVLAFALGFCSLGAGGKLGSLTSDYNFDSSARTNGLGISMLRDIFGAGSAGDELLLEVEEPILPEPAPTTALQEIEETAEPPKVWEPHVLGLDFAELAASSHNSAHKKLLSYLDSQTPALENEYTGLFAGKNLIFITAEAFTKEVIDPELTPTLYRLANEGIRFTDYYQPGWQGGTSGGELANISGLVPNPSSGMMQFSQQVPFTTIGRQLMNLGYFSRAYHNNTFLFYDRYKTHENLGYEKFIAMDSGMEEGVRSVWPQSDEEMIDFTVPQYINNQPFSVYYMTVSGHSMYSYIENAQTRKNYDKVEHLPYSDPVKSYIAANLELENAMRSLVDSLEKAGIADDTVIVISADHYPYGLDTGSTWGNKGNCISELFGVTGKCDNFTRDHNALILWSGCLEGKNITIDTPTYSLDILPTLCNLFGLTYDSRLYVGRDVFSETPALVLWPNFSWITEMGRYDSTTQTFTPAGGVEVPENYVSAVSASVKNKVNYSRSVQESGFLRYLGKVLEESA